MVLKTQYFPLQAVLVIIDIIHVFGRCAPGLLQWATKKKSNSNKQKTGVLLNHLNVNSFIFVLSILLTEVGFGNVKSKNNINFPWSLKCFWPDCINNSRICHFSF